MSRNVIPFAILLLAFGSVRGEPVEADVNLEQDRNRAIPRFDRLNGRSGWGHAVDGLRAKVLRPAGRKKIGEAVPIVLVIRNDGTPQSPQGTAVLGPRLSLRVSRNEWVKSLIVPVHQLNPKSYLSLEKGGEYTVSAGHSNHIVSDSGDWTGNVHSPFQAGVVVVEREKEAELDEPLLESVMASEKEPVL